MIDPLYPSSRWVNFIIRIQRRKGHPMPYDPGAPLEGHQYPVRREENLRQTSRTRPYSLTPNAVKCELQSRVYGAGAIASAIDFICVAQKPRQILSHHMRCTYTERKLCLFQPHLCMLLSKPLHPTLYLSLRNFDPVQLLSKLPLDLIPSMVCMVHLTKLSVER